MDNGTSRGSCLCEGVVFEIDGQPEATFWCYCSHCKKSAGGPGQISAKFDKHQVTILQGADIAQIYILSDTLSGSDKHKVFCSICGCTLWTVPMKHQGDKLIVRTSIINNGLDKFHPKAEFFAASKPLLPGAMKTFETMPGH